MEWRDEAIVLSARRHGETAAIVECLTCSHGRHLGLVHGGASRGRSSQLQAGQSATVVWRARLSENLGTFQIEPMVAHGARMMSDRLRLAGLAAVCAVASATLPEREPHEAVYEGLGVLLPLMAEADHRSWGAVIARWELGLLQELGFGLDLSRCAATGAYDDLAFVSPRSGRAVSRDAGVPYASRLFPMPAFFLGTPVSVGATTPLAHEVSNALKLTAHFLETSILIPHGQRLPEARARFANLFGEIS